MADPTPPAVVARIIALCQQDLPAEDIAATVGVALRTVARYRELDLRARGLPDERAQRRHEPKRPLYDPKRDGQAEQDLTAQICGDPQPQRRELVARTSPVAPRKLELWRDSSREE